MGEAVNYIALAIPVFFLLIGVELLIAKMKKTKLYRFNDAVTNISCGIGQQIVGVFLKTVLIVGYVYLYENHRLISDISATSPITWILLFIGVDFFYYWFHRLAHEISFLWGSHVVHHQSEEYNLSVALRQSWVQSIFSSVFYLPLAIIGFNPIMFIVINQFQTLYQFWIHTRTIGKLPKPIELVFNTPSHHRVHHGINPKYIDKNHGGTLIIFDRMFGTFQNEEEEVVYGVTQQPDSWNPLWLNFEYWAWMMREFFKADNWRDKLGILIKEPGWTPNHTRDAKPVTPQTFHKYDTDIPQGLNYYVLFHYVVILLGTTGFLFLGDGLDIAGKLLTGLLILVSIINLGGIFEKRRWVWWLEHARLLASAILLYFLFAGTAYVLPVSIMGVAMLIISAIWLNGYGNLFKKPAMQ